MLRGNILFFIFAFAFFLPAHAQYITYQSDVKPIIDRHCVSCHQAGDIGAMRLTTYEEVASFGKMIEYVTSTRLMPPWYADPSYSHFKNERLLTETEIQTIRDWVAGDMKEGALPYGQAISSTVGVTVYPREPDLTLSMSQAFEQYGIYMDQYQVFVIPTNLDEDKWIEAIEFVPGNKKIVRHASISVSPHGVFDSLDRWDPRYGYYSYGDVGQSVDQPHWYTWSPQQKASYYHEGQGKFLPKGSDLIVHVHYGPTGKPLEDSSSVKLHFASERIKQFINTTPLINPYTLSNDSFYIRANEKKIFHASYTLPHAIQLFSLTPQANLLCRSWEIFAVVPDKSEPVKLLKIKEWNANWKQTYHFESPVLLPEGTTLHALAHYDNTPDNPCNPSDKPRDVGWGAHLFNELFFTHFEYAVDPPSSTHRVLHHTPAVVSSDYLKVYLLVLKKGEYRFEITSSDKRIDPLVLGQTFKTGQQHLELSVRELPYGNYVLKIYDEDDRVLASSDFIKMRKKGL
jgi:hypothetical protein